MYIGLHQMPKLVWNLQEQLLDKNDAAKRYVQSVSH